MKEVVLVDQISKSFKKGSQDIFLALDQLSLSIYPGDFITVVGGNGAGKSTFFQALAGSFFVDSGSIWIKGKDVTRENEMERAKNISRVFQDPKMGVAPRMTVAENLALAERRGLSRGLHLALNQDLKEKYKYLLKPLGLGLETRLDTAMEFLSGGQRQAVALVMATLVRPDILLLDEHTASLDPKTSRIILEETKKQIKEKELTSLMITHNLKDALDFGNRMILLNHGKLYREFTWEEKKKMTPTDLYALMSSLD